MSICWSGSFLPFEIMTDENGRVVFLSSAAQQLFAKAEVNKVEMPWNDLFALDPEDTIQLQALIRKPPAERAKIPVHLDRTDGRRVWLEVDVRDDPRDARGKIFFFYDVTEVHEYGRLKIQLRDRRPRPSRFVFFASQI